MTHYHIQYIKKREKAASSVKYNLTFIIIQNCAHSLHIISYFKEKHNKIRIGRLKNVLRNSSYTGSVKNAY